MKKVLILFLCLLVYTLVYPSNNSKIDSVQSILKNAKHDTTKVKSLILLSEIYYQTNPDSLEICCKKALQIIEYNLAKEIPKKDKKFYIIQKGTAYTNLGAATERKGNFKEALNLYNKGLRCYKQAEYLLGVSTSYNNLGKLMKVEGEIEEALRLYQESIKYADKCGDRKGKAYTLGNIGAIYYTENDYDRALEYFIKAKVIHQDVNDIYGLCIDLNNIGSVYRNLGKYDLALKSYSETLALSKKNGDLNRQANSLIKIAAIHEIKGNIALSKKYAQKSLKIAQNYGDVKGIMKASYFLYKLNKKTNNKTEALNNYELYIEMRDSIKNEQNLNAIIEQKVQFEYEKKAIADSIKFAEEKRAELKIKNAELEKKKIQGYTLYGGLSAAILLALFIYNRLRLSRKQEKIIAEQKIIVEEKNREITDSINYAQNIQTAILPDNETIKKYLPNSFILYIPKDIVAGDFYWLHKLGDEILFAAADCTGHGVPGAMVSVVCSNALNRAVGEMKLTKPHLILDKVRELVIEQLDKSNKTIRDGMDIALCNINLKTNMLQYAGAYNSLFYIRNNKLNEIKADRQPIGKYFKETPFTNHQLQLQKDDVLYMSTDGYPDQFGGEKGKKINMKGFKALLYEFHHLPMEQQKENLLKFFIKWKGDIEQIDDVCVIGLKI